MEPGLRHTPLRSLARLLVLKGHSASSHVAPLAPATCSYHRKWWVFEPLFGQQVNGQTLSNTPCVHCKSPCHAVFICITGAALVNTLRPGQRRLSEQEAQAGTGDAVVDSVDEQAWYEKPQTPRVSSSSSKRGPTSIPVPCTSAKCPPAPTSYYRRKNVQANAEAVVSTVCCLHALC